MKNLTTKILIYGLLVLALIASVGCTAKPAQTEEPVAPLEQPTTPPEPTVAPEESEPFLGCIVTTGAGVNDKGFNQQAYEGLLEAQNEYGIEIKFLEPKAQSEYEVYINTLLREGCNIVATVGYEFGDNTKLAAEANPDKLFTIVDFAYDPTIPNIKGQVYKVEEVSMLAGYLAAGMSKTGKISTFGGMDIQPVWDWIYGIAAGINYYNEVHGTEVTLIGADPATHTGAFTGDWVDKDKGKQLALNAIQEGADIVIPIAGPAGYGAFAAAQETDTLAIGGDGDQAVLLPEYSDFIIVSMLKNVGVGVKTAVKEAIDGNFDGGTNFVGTLANGGVGLTPFYKFEDKVPADLLAEIEELRLKIVSGEVVVADWIVK